MSESLPESSVKESPLVEAQLVESHDAVSQETVSEVEVVSEVETVVEVEDGVEEEDTVQEEDAVVAEADEPTSGVTFASLNLSEPILRAVVGSGYTVATPIQAAAIPPLLEGRDVLGQAQTGTGKTAAFALPLLQRIDLDEVHPQVLVLTPTRELAIQVAEAFERYASGLNGLRVTAIYGGQDYQVQFRDLDRGVHVVVGTPGRVMDHMRRGSLPLDGVGALVLDEADEMLRMGFAEDVEFVLSQLPEERQIALFSATMPDQIRAIAQNHLHDPVEITLEQGPTAAETVRQRYLVVPPPAKQQALVRVLEAEPTDGVIVFVKTKSTSEYLADMLSAHGFRTAALSSDVAQKQRERIVENLRACRLDVIVATDVAARGLDVSRISHVINYDYPFDAETYVHRIGRTGRAGRDGDAILFLNTRERHLLRRLERAVDRQIEPMEVPSKRDVNQRRVARFHEKITTSLTRDDLGTFTSLVEQYRRDNPEVSLEHVAASLAALAVGDGPFLVKEDFTQANFRESKTMRDNGRHPFEDRPRERGFGNGDRREPRHLPRERPARQSASYGPTETFRIEVGRVDGVKPGNIVGAIANEAGVDGACIGRIEIFDRHCHLDMPAGMPDGMLESLQRVVVAGRSLQMSRVADGEGERPNFARPEFARPGLPRKRKFEKPAGRFEEQGPPRSTENKKFGARKKFADKPAFGEKPKFGKSKFAGKAKFAKRAEGEAPVGKKPAFPAKPSLGGKFKTQTKARPKPLKRVKPKS